MHEKRTHLFAQLYGWLTERLYNEFAWAYDPVSWLVSLGGWSTWRRAALAYVVGERVLEVGFGTGELLIEMSSLPFLVFGLERSPAMQRVTGRKLRRHNIGLPRMRAAVQQMPFVDNSFDTIVSTFPAGYIFEPHTWREVARLLSKPGARFIVVGIGGSRAGRGSLSWPERAIFGSGLDEMLARLENLARLAGLQPQVIPRQYGKLVMPILLAEKTQA